MKSKTSNPDDIFCLVAIFMCQTDSRYCSDILNISFAMNMIKSLRISIAMVQVINNSDEIIVGH